MLMLRNNLRLLFLFSNKNPPKQQFPPTHQDEIPQKLHQPNLKEQNQQQQQLTEEQKTSQKQKISPKHQQQSQPKYQQKSPSEHKQQNTQKQQQQSRPMQQQNDPFNQSQPGPPIQNPNSNQDFDKSFSDFTKKYTLDTKDKVHKKIIQESVLPQIKQQVGTEHKALNKHISNQADQMKAKLLSGKCIQQKEANQQYSLLGRGEQVYLNHRKHEQEENLINQQQEVQNLEEGEEGIDFVMVPEEFKKQVYFAKTYGHRRIEEAYREQEGFAPLTSKTKYANIAEWRQMNYGFQPVQKQYEAHPKHQYPGSINGSEPEDDPIAFRDWYISNHPKKVVEEMYELASTLTQHDKDVTEEEEGEMEELPTQTYTSAHEAIQPSTNIHLLDNDVEGEMMSAPHQWVFRSIIKDNDIEPLPDKLPVDPLKLFDQIEKWSHFRWLSLVVKCSEVMNQDGNAKKLPILTSLYPYYCTLPKFAREHPSVKIAYKNLEFNKFSLSIEEKERALNYICYATLDMDELTDAVCTDLAATRRHHPTIDDERILIHENEKDIIDGYLNPLARDKYLATKPILPNLNPPEGDYPYPFPQRFVTEEQDLTPVDFYDNDDGFWDDHIKAKHESYIKAHRPSTSRQFFKH